MACAHDVHDAPRAGAAAMGLFLLPLAPQVATESPRGAAVRRARGDNARRAVVFAHCARTRVSVVCILSGTPHRAVPRARNYTAARAKTARNLRAQHLQRAIHTDVTVMCSRA